MEGNRLHYVLINNGVLIIIHQSLHGYHNVFTCQLSHSQHLAILSARCITLLLIINHHTVCSLSTPKVYSRLKFPHWHYDCMAHPGLHKYAPWHLWLAVEAPSRLHHMARGEGTLVGHGKGTHFLLIIWTHKYEPTCNINTSHNEQEGGKLAFCTGFHVFIMHYNNGEYKDPEKSNHEVGQVIAPGSYSALVFKPLNWINPYLWLHLIIYLLVN